MAAKRNLFFFDSDGGEGPVDCQLSSRRNELSCQPIEIALAFPLTGHEGHELQIRHLATIRSAIGPFHLLFPCLWSDGTAGNPPNALASVHPWPCCILPKTLLATRAPDWRQLIAAEASTPRW